MAPVLSRRSRALVVGLLAAATVLGTTAAAGAAPPPGTPANSDHSPAYLALGDSVPFGFAGGQSAADYADPTNFVGYPQLVGADTGLRVLNASCPGETTASFLDPTAQSNGCEDTLRSETAYRDLFPLHVAYTPGPRDQPQLDYAIKELKRDKDIQLVTLQIGANDIFLCQQSTADGCSSPAELTALARQVAAGVGTILSRLRTEGHYTGQIVVVDYYAVNYLTPDVAAIRFLDDTIDAAAAAQGAQVASGFAAFAPTAVAAGGSTVAAGLVLPGDVHPTLAGQRLLADAVEAVIAG